MSTAIRALHVLAAITWVGGRACSSSRWCSFPACGASTTLGCARVMHVVGIRFRAVGWIALGVMVATGSGTSGTDPICWPCRASSSSWRWWRIALIVAAVHDFVVGPRAGAPGADSAWRSRASWIARINVLVVVAIVVLGVALRG